MCYTVGFLLKKKKNADPHASATQAKSLASALVNGILCSVVFIYLYSQTFSICEDVFNVHLMSVIFQ